MNVLLISPAYPAEMPRFAEGLARVGARVLGLADTPKQALDPKLRHLLTDYLQVPKLFDEPAVERQVAEWSRRVRIDRVECLWEPGMLLAGRIRDRLQLPGLGYRQTIPFRDKEAMKQVLDAAGVRTPRHARAKSGDAIREAAERINYPLIVKPIAGGGSADTYRIDNRQELEWCIPRLRSVDEVSVEEFIDGDELTFDTLCADGEVLFENICAYRPRPLDEKKYEWISPQTFAVRQIDAPALAGGRAMGHQVLEALGFRSGFTHMEWFKRPDGEVVFGEIGARPPGARMVDVMNYAADVDTYTGWAETICHGRFSQDVPRRHNAVMVVKRARGQGRIRRIEGLERLRHELGDRLVCIDLLPVGARRRDWQMTSISDGYVIARDPDWATTVRMADHIGRTLQLHAG